MGYGLLEEYNSPVGTGVGGDPHPGPDGKFAVFQAFAHRRKSRGRPSSTVTSKRRGLLEV